CGYRQRAGKDDQSCWPAQNTLREFRRDFGRRGNAICAASTAIRKLVGGTSHWSFSAEHAIVARWIWRSASAVTFSANHEDGETAFNEIWPSARVPIAQSECRKSNSATVFFQ